jgi:M6 family metalloprotease-like protein
MSRIKSEKILIKQENGKSITLTVSGDEFYSRCENGDGYTMLYDAKLGCYCFAQVAEGKFVSTGTPATSPPPTGLRKHLRESGRVITTKFRNRFRLLKPAVIPTPSGGPAGLPLQTSAPDNGLLEGPKLLSGKIRGITVLVEFPDVPFTHTKNEISALLNDDHYTKHGNFCSVRGYYLLMSGGQLDYSNEVFGPVKLRRKRSHYHFTRKNNLLRDTMRALVKNKVNLKSFDSNGDKKIDAVNIVYAGSTQYVDRSWLWPHSFSNEMRFGDVSTSMYQICSLESMSIGTFCHENGHMLCRFPDLYDYGNRDTDFVRSSGLGNYCLMSAGNHLDGGRTPSPICAYLRHLAGWCTDVVSLNKPGTYETVHGAYATVHKYRLDDLPNEYFLVENRYKTGLDASLPASGLAVYHCDINGSNEWQQGTPTKHFQCGLIQADGNGHLENGTNNGDRSDLFSSQNGTALAYGTKPSSQRWDRSDSGLNIADIGAPGTTTAFRTL